jgi:hypothetical protein
MAISLICPGCHKTINAPEKFAGKKGTCPFCKTLVEIRVPSAANVAAGSDSMIYPPSPPLPQPHTMAASAKPAERKQVAAESTAGVSRPMLIAMIGLPTAAILIAAGLIWSYEKSRARAQREEARVAAERLFGEAQQAIEQEKLPEATKTIKAYLSDENGAKKKEARKLLAEIAIVSSKTAASETLVAIGEEDFLSFQQSRHYSDARITHPALAKLWNATLASALPEAKQKREEANAKRLAEMARQKAEKAAALEKSKKEQAKHEAAQAKKQRSQCLAKVRDGADPYEAARSLAGGGVDAVPEVVALLDDMNPRVRLFAVLALGAIGPDAKAAVPTLTAIVLKDPEFRIDAARSLGKIGPPARSAISTLFLALREDPSAESVLETALNGIDPKAGEFYRRLLDLQAKMQALKTQGTLANLRTQNALRGGNTQAEVTQFALEAADVARQRVSVAQEIEKVTISLIRDWKTE